MEYTIENLEQAVAQFYQPYGTTEKSHAHNWLRSAQASPQAWVFVWDLLQPNKPTELQFFAATTLHTKVLKYWHEVPETQYDNLKQQLLEMIISHSNGPKIVLYKLCVVLSTFILQTLPSHWCSAITDLVSGFQHPNVPSMSPDRSIWILMDILTVIAEEFQSMQFSHVQKGLVSAELHKNIPQVLSLLDSTLVQDVTNVTEQAVLCANAWLQFGIPLPDCEMLADRLVSVAFKSAMTSDIGLFEKGIDALSNMATHHETHKFPSLCMQLISKLLPLYEIVQRQTSENNEFVYPTYNLLVSVAERHSRLLLDMLLQDESTRSKAQQLIHVVLQCSNSPGCYPLHETASQLPLGFWYILQDDMLSYDSKNVEVLLPLIKPVYKSLTEIMIYKSVLPSSEEGWSVDDKELLRCYRQDIADTLIYCYNVLHDDLLEIIQLKLQESGNQWQILEACLHAYFAVAECVGLNEEIYIPQLLQNLKQIPFAHMDIRVLVTASDTIGAYAEWINAHPTMLPQVIPLLVVGLENPDVAPSATMALKDLTRDCQDSLKPFAHTLLQASQEALQRGQLRQAECGRLMLTVGRVLSVLPLDGIMGYLDQLLIPYIEELQILKSETNILAKTNILLRLKMLSSLFATLDTKSEQNHTSEIQPVFLVLKKLLPVLQSIGVNWHDDDHVIQSICLVFKYGLTTLMDDCKPLLPDILELLIKNYMLKPLPCILELAQQYLVMFGRDSACKSMMDSLLKELCAVTLAHCYASNNLSDLCDLLEAFFNLLAQVLKKTPELFVNAPNVNIGELFHCGVLVISIPEVSTLKAVTSFLVNFISQSREYPMLLPQVQNYGETLVYQVIKCIGGGASRSSVDPMAEILLILNKKYCDNLCRWLNQVLQSEGFPSPQASTSQKKHFANMILKERANKRKLQDTVREFSLICRGLMGTEYGAQVSSFL